MMLQKVWGQESSRDDWSAGSVQEPSSDKDTSRDTSALMSGKKTIKDRDGGTSRVGRVVTRPKFRPSSVYSS